MPAIIATEFTGTVTYLGYVSDRKARLASEPLTQLQADFAGYRAEAHAGVTRPSDSRVKMLYPMGTEIRNTRQFSIQSAEELAEIAALMGLADFDPAWIGSSMVITGIPDLTHLPPSSRLQFPSGATLTADMENRPCVLPAPEINKAHDGAGRLFKTAAKDKRGITAWVEREGVIKLGDQVQLFVPDQPAWRHLKLSS